MATPSTPGSPQAIPEPFGSLSSRLWVLAWFAVLSLVMTFPLALHAGEAIPGYPGANLTALHDLYHFRESVVSAGRWPEAPAASPISGALAAAGPDVLVGNKLLSAPLLFWGGEVMAYNGIVLLSLVLSGYGAYLLIVYLTGQPLAAVVGGTAFALCPYRQHVLVAGWLPLLSTQWIPLAFLYAERALREGRARHAALAGAFVGLSALTAWPYLVAVGLPLLGYVLLRPWFGPHTVRRSGLMRRLLVGVVVALALSAPVIGSLLGGGAAGMAGGGVSADQMALPSVYHPWWGARLWSRRPYPLTYPSEAPGVAYLGAIAGLLGAVALLRRRDEAGSTSALFWTGAIAALLACGAALRSRGAPVAIGLSQGAGGLASLAEKLQGLAAAEATSVGVASAKALPVLLPGVALQRLGAALDLPISFFPFGAVAALALASLAGIGVARLIGGGTAVGAPGRRDLIVAAGPARNVGRAALTGALCTALVLADFAMGPLVGGLTMVGEQPLDRWIAGQGDALVVIAYPLERNATEGRYHARYHGAASAYDALAARGLTAHDAALLAAFPHPESLAFLRSQGVTHIIVASEGYARVTGRSWEVTRAALEAAPGVRPAGVAREESSWRYETLSKAIGVGAWLVTGPADMLYVYALER